ncbi:MAG: excinuclease ABC subunit UvrC [Gammaproteobacteria bacterium]|nr:excinuclease ABC subunit UvrC [Gammaproteobacteria bacterium]MCH9763877.1 excinuclease ABC subunit UvrC [Gammaproteobacteria bacterium]
MKSKTLSVELTDILKHLPTSPGVYCMRDINKRVIYVGKATDLKKRVQSYFNQSDKGSKTRALVTHIVSIDVSVTRSETEALLLESQLIKTLRPKYNILMRDDKSYPYLHLDLAHAFPSLGLARSKKNPQTKGYFGPYPSVVAVRETLNTIQKVFKLRNCRDSDFSARTRPCLQYQIGRCRAPCVGNISEAMYTKSVQDAVRFLEGKSQTLLKALQERMDEAVEVMAFEEAAMLRDQIKHLRLIQEQQGVTGREGDADVIVSEVQSDFACVQWVSIRGGEIIGNQAFFPAIPNAGLEESALKQAVFEAFIAHHYLDTPARIPALILTNQVLDNQAVWENALKERRGRTCRIQQKARGVRARWIDFAEDNLKRSVAVRNTSKIQLETRYQALEAGLKLKHAITQMVCFDISHTQGQDPIASCVVFDRNGPLKSAYRRLNIRDVTPGDDYAAMAQAVSRYFNGLLRDDKPWPTLVIIDGGKGQVSVSKKALDALNGPDIMILGVAKGVTRKAGLERLILADSMQEMCFASDSPALHLLQHIRDEAHRFAITSHRKKRQKTSLSSALDNIPGVGEKRRQALLKQFGGMRELSKAPLEELIKVDGISQTLATTIYNYLH